MAMSSIDIITFYAIYIPVVMAAIIIGFILGYKMAGRRKNQPNVSPNKSTK